MPNAINAVAPSLLMPYALSVSFQQRRDRLVDYTRYGDGSMQSLSPVNSSRRRWVQNSRLAPANLQAMRNFYEAQGGGWLEFYFYDLYETSPIFTYDPTATSLPGLYVVCFDGPWTQSLNLGRNPAQFSLVEVS